MTPELHKAITLVAEALASNHEAIEIFGSVLADTVQMIETGEIQPEAVASCIVFDFTDAMSVEQTG